MKIEWFSHEGVDSNGDVADGGNVCVDGHVWQSAPKGGCGLPGCNCSAGHWISKSYPRTAEGVVAGFLAQFEDRAELERYSMDDLEQAALKARQ